jgi:hypothetical protein
MKTLEYYTPNEEGYRRAALFAKGVYKEKLNFHLEDFPEFLFVIEENENVLGCIGLNRNVHGSLFLRDNKVRRFIDKTARRESVGEQSILAVEGYPFGIVLLVAAFSECAYHFGIDKVMFAGTDIAMRTFTHMGAALITVKEADERVLLPSEKENYRTWFSLNKPMVCAIPTAQMPEIAKKLFIQHHKRLLIGQKLLNAQNIRIAA